MKKLFDFRNYKFEVGRCIAPNGAFYAARHKPVLNADGKIVKGSIDVRYFYDTKVWDALSSKNVADYQEAKVAIRHLFSDFKDIKERML